MNILATGLEWSSTLEQSQGAGLSQQPHTGIKLGPLGDTEATPGAQNFNRSVHKGTATQQLLARTPSAVEGPALYTWVVPHFSLVCNKDR